MNPETKEKVLSATEKFLDEVDEVMKQVDEKYHLLEAKAREMSDPHIESLEKWQSDLKTEFERVKATGEDAGEAINKTFNEYAVGFMRAYEDLVNSNDDDDSDGSNDGSNKYVDWTDVPPPTIQLGYPNPAQLDENQGERR